MFQYVHIHLSSAQAFNLCTSTCYASICGSGCGLTFSSPIYQYKEAAGLDLSEEQLAVTKSPIWYVGCRPLMTGSCFGKADGVQNVMV